VERPLRFAVAVSGGRDSVALLHCARAAAAPLGLEPVALHVHHGLLPGADGWAEQVRSLCRGWRVPFAAAFIDRRPGRGDSVEAWARRVRYEALATLAAQQAVDLVLLAHHRRDQAETFLIQALRGGGAAGLAAMPRAAGRGGITWARPWLDLPREAIEAYARRHRLRFVHDPSNADSRLARGRLRGALWAELLAAFPDAETTLARAAQRAADDAAIVAEVAQGDLARLRDASSVTDTLDVARWLELSPPRRRSALRLWLGSVMREPVPETLVRRLATELPACRSARWPAGPDQLVLRRGRLALETPTTTGSASLGT
jgi:tRNA(Ile)-lysidine synthase